MTTEQAEGFSFPCDYEIKAMGIDDGHFHELIVEIVERHTSRIRADSLRQRSSRGGKYVSVSLVIKAQSRAQLDAIYADLTAHEQVLMRL